MPQHHRRGRAPVDRIRQLHGLVGRHHAHIGVAADQPGAPGDAIPGRELADAVADRPDRAGTFEPESAWQRQRIQAAAVRCR